MELAGGLEDSQGPQADDVGGVQGLVERDPDVALGAEVVHLVGPDLLHDLREARCIGQVGVVELESVAHARAMRKMWSIRCRLSVLERPNQPVDLVFRLPEQEFGQVGPILSGDPGDQMHASWKGP